MLTTSKRAKMLNALKSYKKRTLLLQTSGAKKGDFLPLNFTKKLVH